MFNWIYNGDSVTIYLKTLEGDLGLLEPRGRRKLHHTTELTWMVYWGRQELRGEEEEEEKRPRRRQRREQRPVPGDKCCGRERDAGM